MTTVLRKQQELMEKIENKPPAERRVEGISIPHYGDSFGESLELFLDQARLFFEAKNIDYTHEDNRKRVLAIMVSNLTGQAAAWYITKQHEINDITALAAAPRVHST
ncbi:Gag/polymerase/env Polyprotein [Phytophthora cinnamomi]|uniref:Gag/polymerase/env Polyprotein n=1 Tax=Phytophthora cinnamomi TaxID=4785 RepID=UPI00355ABE5C|nr:Gag/polymerase/env Polyprotein [Phytophthora cinnamomi]